MTLRNPFMLRQIRFSLTACALCLLSAFQFASADAPSTIKPVGMGLGGFTYWSSSPFGNAMLSAHDWIEFGPSEWGSTVRYEGNPQFDANGYPKYLNPNKKLRTLMWPFSARYSSSSPADWPDRGATGTGKWVLTWEGDADLRLQGGSFVAGESNGPQTGRITNGRRVYQFSSSQTPGHLTVEDVNAADPVTDIKAWMPDPADPTNQTLEGTFWHPTFLSYLADMDLNHLRFMDWGDTNASPQMDWIDRRPPSFRHMHGVLNRRSPATGFGGDRGTGISYEYMIQLCNETQLDMWVCLPHLATDDYVRKLAQMILYGSDGTSPYTSPQANPVFPPLDSNLNVWVEYSNEIWSSGNSFPQGNWAQEQANGLGISKGQFNARRYSQIWSIFQDEFGGSSRIVRTAGIWTGSTNYSLPFMTELAAYGPTLTPAVNADVIAPTTYFGNGIQDWIYEQANLTRGTSDQWFHTDQDFPSGSSTRPVSIAKDDPYWTSAKVEQDLDDTFAEWKKRILSGSTLAGGGPDSTGTGGGFYAGLHDDIASIFGQPLPIVAYEGGPSLYTDYYDGGDSRDDGITQFMVILNRQPAFEEIYRMQLNMAFSKGLTSHALFVDVSNWGKYGQWGHLEYPDQDPSEAIKWTAVKNWVVDMQSINHIDDLVGSRPSFDTPGTLPQGLYNTSYSEDIVVSGGDCAIGPTFTVIGSQLVRGLELSAVPADPYRVRLSGAPQEGGWSYLYLRADDDDGDAVWQIYSLYTSAGPGTLVEADLNGSFAGSADLPWTQTFDVDGRIAWSGIDVGAPYASGGGTATGTDGTGVRVYSATSALRFSVSQGGATQNDSTLASAITDDEYWSFTLTPYSGQSINLRKAEIRFNWVRYDYHAPREFAVFSSVEGFAEGNQFYTLAQFPSEDVPTEHVFTFPDTAAYENLTTPVEVRIYLYRSQYAHQAGILGLKVSENLVPGSYPHWAASVDWKALPNDASDDANQNDIENLIEYALDLDPTIAHPANAYPIFEYDAATPGGPWTSLTFRQNVTASDVSWTVQRSNDLDGWSDLTHNGTTIIEEIMDADPDGDGSARLIRIRTQAADDPEFLRLKINP